MQFAFGDVLLDTGRRELRRAGERVALEPQVFDLIAFLVRNCDRVVTKDDLLDGVWGRIVSESAISSRINAARKALGDDGETQALIRTIPRKGFRFVAEIVEAEKQTVRQEDLPPALPSPAAGILGRNAADPSAQAGDASGRSGRMGSDGAGPLPLPDKPSIAVLPFQNMSGDPGQDYFVDGMVEEIITALSRIRWLFVIARNSSFTYQGQAVDVKRVGRELGVRYVLEGSVRKGGDQLRITAQLIDSVTGAHLWADRFDGPLEDVFDLQDQVAISVAGVIEPALQAAETALSAGRRTADLTAYDLYLRAQALVLSSTRQAGDALRLLEQALARDPAYPPALAWAAFCCHRLVLDGRSDNRGADRLRCLNFARRGLEVAGHDPAVLVEAAHVLAAFGEDIAAMIALIDRALALNPSFARGWHQSGLLRLWAGQHDIAITHFETSLRLSPRQRVSLGSLLGIGGAHFLAHRFEAALPKLNLAIQQDPSFPQPYRVLAACYAHMGRLEEARETVDRLRELTSVVFPEPMLLHQPEDRELWLSGLRLAMGERDTAPDPVPPAAERRESRAAPARSGEADPLPLPDKPSIAVLPFQNMSGDPEQEYFVDGMVEDIITALSRVRSLFVIARNSSFTYKGRSVDIKQVGRELGVRYVLEGSIRRAGNRVRVTAQLIGAVAGGHVWAERYDRELTDLFAVQDEITQHVSAAIAPAIRLSEGERAARRPPESLSAWEAYHRGLWHRGKYEPAESALAKACFERAIELDPGFAAPHAALARLLLVELREYGQGSGGTPAIEARAFDLAQRAIALDPADANAHSALASFLLSSGRHQESLAEADAAVSLAPNSAAHGRLGVIRLYLGQHREALEALEMAIRLNPVDSLNPAWHAHIARAHYRMANYQQAISVAQAVCRSYPNRIPPHLTLVAALGQIGQVEIAQAVVEQARRAIGEFFLQPEWRWHWPEQLPEHRAHIEDGLRKAGFGP